MKLKQSNGFTLLEVMISMIILALGILGLAPLVGIAIYGNTFSNDLTGANSLAQQEMERLVNMGDYGSLPFVSTVDSVGGMYKVYRTVEDNSINGSIPPGLFKLNVVLSWTDQESMQRTVNIATYKPKS